MNLAGIHLEDLLRWSYLPEVQLEIARRINEQTFYTERDFERAVSAAYDEGLEEGQTDGYSQGVIETTRKVKDAVDQALQTIEEE